MLPELPGDAIDSWHIFVVPEQDPDDPDGSLPTLYHPEDCAVLVHSAGNIHHECATQVQFDHVGYLGLFARHDETLEPGIWLIAPWIEKITGPDWIEYDSGWHVEAFSPAPKGADS